MRAFVLALSAIVISPLLIPTVTLAAVDQKQCAVEATNLLTDQDSKAPVSFDPNGKTVKGKPAEIVTSRKLGRGQAEEITYILKVGPDGKAAKKVRNKVTIVRNDGILQKVTRTHNAHDEYELVGKDKTRTLRYETSLNMRVDGDQCIVDQNLAVEGPWGAKPKERQTVIYYDRTLCANLQPILKQESAVYDGCSAQESVDSEKYRKTCGTLNSEMRKAFTDRSNEVKNAKLKFKWMSATANINEDSFLPEMYAYVAACKARYTEATH
jgi:hypothetical protein